jgi:hypothetical protein
MMHRSPRAIVVALALIALGMLAGCQRPPRATVSIYQQEPRRLNVTGAYRHTASGMEFPPSIGEFNRLLLVQYDRTGRSISARYAIDGATSRIEATIYVYPAQSEGRVERCRTQLEAASTDLVREHPGARRTTVDDVTLEPGGAPHSGRHAAFEYDESLGRETRAAAAELYLFCNAADAWQVEYRFTHPRELNAAPIIDDFMRRLPWTLRAG